MTSTLPAPGAEIDALAPYGGRGQERFERVVALAKELFSVPAAAINIVTDDLVVPLASSEPDTPSLPRGIAPCGRVVEGEGQMVVADAAHDARFAANPLVVDDPHLRFYAGQPLMSEGDRVGTLCLFGTEPRELGVRESQMLRDLAGWVENELAIDHSAREAEQVQQALLPTRPPTFPGVQVAGRCAPARGVAGDLYDWVELDSAVQVVVCDVMGKGIPAAMTASAVRAVLRGASPFNDLDDTMLRIAAAVSDDLAASSSFVTLFLARISADGTVGWVDAGHGLAAVVAADGSTRLLRSRDLPVGVLPDDRWTCHLDRLAVGETLVVISDGVMDTFPDIATAEAALVPIITGGGTAQEVVDAIVGHALLMAPPRGSRDDITALVARRVD